MGAIKMEAIQDQTWTLGQDYALPVTLKHNDDPYDVTARTSRLRFRNQDTGATFERTESSDWITHTTPASGLITFNIIAAPTTDGSTVMPPGAYVVDFRSEAAGANYYYDSAVWTFKTPAGGLY